MKNFGYIEPKKTHKDFKFGGITALKGTPLTDGHWLKYLPVAEDQDTVGPTYACTSFGTLNALETIFKFMGVDKNFSDRFLAIVSGTDPTSGNDPVKVIDTARTTGLISETDLPYDSSITSVAQFYSPRPMTQNYLDEADQFLNQYGLAYDDVYPTPDTLKQALCYSPLGVAVKAWFPRPNSDLYYFPDTLPYNHWCALVDYEDGQFWYIFDSYENNIKKIEWNSVFGKTLRYAIGKPTDFQLSFIERILQKYALVVNLMQKLYTMLMPEPTVVPDSQPIPPPATPVDAIKTTIADTAAKNGVEPQLALAVASCEGGTAIPNARNKNTNGSTDRGCFQWNDKFFPAITDAMADDPATACKLFCDAVKQGKLKTYWSASMKCWEPKLSSDITKKYNL